MQYDDLPPEDQNSECIDGIDRDLRIISELFYRRPDLFISLEPTDTSESQREPMFKLADAALEKLLAEEDDESSDRS